ncbi:glycyl-radical enzyme activating protein [Extibacter muris]|uniref:glycyl-radical enzyme activating protein n=1 Tax=Extibacter muris TaxID=1796622 RepID=UPI001D0691CB|nr:glycyl-radical enzyme activating protein [Extibacter muris]MCB6201989.1 glycyl-radical enzyme activating protein [Extibacter muris]MCQ4663338.1 glycyl-radical enzyme activating protein [Extibacter muris]MCQ4692622.1 glycyl-radical enzyme activating protein [Extibacter muris]
MSKMEADKPLTGIITDIQRYSVHDGPGIRTLIFFKGCPLRCRWCQNPETWHVRPELMIYPDSCIGCGLCSTSCPTQAAHGVRTDRGMCRECGLCAQVCPSQARKMAGRGYTVEEVVDIVIRDKVFYDRTGGGVTLSGGEPLHQSSFAGHLLDTFRELAIHTAIETCGYGSEDTFVQLAGKTDCILFDVKHMDEDIHKKYTGVSNRRILGNIRKAGRMGRNIIIRIPLIPGVNDTAANIGQVCALADEVGAEEIHLLPFHQAGEEKWSALGRCYTFEHRRLLEREEIEAARALIESKGIPVDVGGGGIYRQDVEEREGED